MKKIINFVGMHEVPALEEAVQYSKQNDKVFFVACDKTIRVCQHNPFGSVLRCMFCNYAMKRLIKKIGANIYYVSISELITNEIIKISNRITWEYNDVKSLKEIKYKGIEVGYGAFSTYVTITRNVMPSFTQSFKRYIDYIIKKEIILSEVLFKYCDYIKPDLIIFHNGRFNNVKPIYNIAKNYGIDYIATECKVKDGRLKKNNFVNTIPHSFDALDKKIEYTWQTANESKYDIAKLFFTNRRNSKPAGDIVYTKDQHVGELPDGFDKSKRNISIFNSSEDEFFAISKEYDQSVLYPNQFEALSKIFEHYKNNSDIHFYLRIHPNLKNVPYKSHTLLYTLKYDNVTIIPPLSTISSYALMDNSEKVIVFNSTMGLESGYWGKPVINLNRCIYSKQDIAYSPQNESELFNLIDDTGLQTKKQPIENWYKVAYYLLGNGGEDYKYYRPLISEKKLFKYKLHINSVFKILGSSFLYALVFGFISFASQIGVGTLFTKKQVYNSK